MAGVDNSSELLALSKQFSSGEIEEEDYRLQRSVMIDRYCGVESRAAKSRSEENEEYENALTYYSMLGTFGVILIIFVAYLFTSTDAALIFEALGELVDYAKELISGN